MYVSKIFVHFLSTISPRNPSRVGQKMDLIRTTFLWFRSVSFNLLIAFQKLVTWFLSPKCLFSSNSFFDRPARDSGLKFWIKRSERKSLKHTQAASVFNADFKCVTSFDSNDNSFDQNFQNINKNDIYYKKLYHMRFCVKKNFMTSQ